MSSFCKSHIYTEFTLLTSPCHLHSCVCTPRHRKWIVFCDLQIQRCHFFLYGSRLDFLTFQLPRFCRRFLLHFELSWGKHWFSNIFFLLGPVIKMSQIHLNSDAVYKNKVNQGSVRNFLGGWLVNVSNEHIFLVMSTTSPIPCTDSGMHWISTPPLNGLAKLLWYQCMCTKSL